MTCADCLRPCNWSPCGICRLAQALALNQEEAAEVLEGLVGDAREEAAKS